MLTYHFKGAVATSKYQSVDALIRGWYIMLTNGGYVYEGSSISSNKGRQIMLKRYVYRGMAYNAYIQWIRLQQGSI